MSLPSPPAAPPPTSAPGDAPVTPPPTGPRVVVTRAATAAAVLFALWWLGPQLGMIWKPVVPLTLFVGVVGIWCLPAHALWVAGLCGAAVLFEWGALRTFGYHILLIALTYAVRRKPWFLVSALLFGVIVLPKELFRLFYHQPFRHDWVNPFLLPHLFLVVLLWWSNERRGRITDTGFSGWLCLLLFPSHPFNPLPFSPTDLWRGRSAATRDVLRGLGVLACKAAAMWLCMRLFPQGQLSQQSEEALLGASVPRLWFHVALSYLICALLLSGTADVAVVVARLFGWNLGHSFRWALLAWNPVELWRRWAIYNRRLLLTLVYFPLGGGNRHRSLNVMLTFAASGLVLHSGWLGSRYWEVGPAGWRDQTLYFLLQGAAVVACLQYWRWRGKDPAADRALRWSWGRALTTVLTQALSAWVHVIVLAPQVSLGVRLRLMLRCFGIEL
ncbi:MAG TPA: hypothetical protein VGG33_10985 [Polyangia bacterium]